MKKILLLILIIFLITGCNNKNKGEEKVVDKLNDVIETEEEKYVDDNPIIVGLYENDIRLVKEYTISKESFKDLIFGVYYTNEENLESHNQKYNWNKYYSQYSNIDDYKIGFSFKFYSDQEKIEKTILGPDTFAFNPYFYIYIYDDINQPDGTFYSHIEVEDLKEDTIFSSIKIYLVEVDKITSPIEFTVFTYNGEEDFDEFNNYRGNSKYTININLQ